MQAQAQTAFAAAFQKSGANVDEARLAVAAVKALQRCDGSPERAIGLFAETLETDRGLRWAGYLRILREHAEDMRGTSLTRGGQSSPVAHSLGATTGQPVEDDGGRPGVAAKARGAMPSLSSPSSGGAGQILPAASAKSSVPASPDPVCDGGGHIPSDAHGPSAPSVAKPVHNPPRSNLAALAGVQAAVERTILDTFFVRDGRPIGDLTWSELITLARTNEAEARVLRYVQGFAANVRPEALVRDVVRPSFVEEAVRLAGEAADVH